jgi:putative transposase
VLLTSSSSFTNKNIKFFNQPRKKRAINTLDNTIVSLQRKKAYYEQTQRSTKNIGRKLIELSQKRRDLAIQYDHKLTADLVDWINQLTHRYNVHVAIGRLTGIRASHQKGDGKSRYHRRKLHQWSFQRVTNQLKYKLTLKNFLLPYFHDIKESWTSRTCSKCGSRETLRPFQALVRCQSCGAQLQADINGAFNIAFKLIVSLSDEAALDHWLPNPLFVMKYHGKSVSTAGRKIECTSQSSLISSPFSGDERPAVVPPTVQNPQAVDRLSTEMSGDMNQLIH